MSDSFQIKFNRSGGFTGIGIAIHVNSENLNQPEKETLQQLINESEIKKYPQTGNDHNHGIVDGFQYEIELKADDQILNINFTDLNMPEKFKPLIRKLTMLARHMK